MVKIKKRTLVIFSIIILLFLAYKFTRPSYPDINTPKPIYGNENSNIIVIEFSDIQCPACTAANPVINQIKEEYKDKIRFQYYHFPLKSIHPYAQKSAEAAECANDQNKFYEYIDAAFAISPDLSTKNLKIVAQQLSLDTKTFNTCLDSGAKKGTVQKDYEYGLLRGVQGTPTIFINDKKAENWGYETLKQIIDAEIS